MGFDGYTTKMKKLAKRIGYYYNINNKQKLQKIYTCLKTKNPGNTVAPDFSGGNKTN